MRALFIPAFLVMGLGGCVQGPRFAAAPPMYAPCAVIAAGSAHARPMDVLPASEAEDYFIPRGEKVVFGAVPLSGFSAFTIYTYDAQRLSDRQGDFGYRYRWIVQNGFSGTLPP